MRHSYRETTTKSNDKIGESLPTSSKLPVLQLEIRYDICMFFDTNLARLG